MTPSFSDISLPLTAVHMPSIRTFAARPTGADRLPTINALLGARIDLVILVRALRAGTTRAHGLPAINALPRYLDHMGFDGALGTRSSCAYRLSAIFTLGHSDSLIGRN